MRIAGGHQLSPTQNLIAGGMQASVRNEGVATDPYWSSVVLSCPFTDDEVDLKGHTVTLTGNAAVSGGYMNLDGNGDYASVTASADFNMGTGDFTYEFVVNFTDAPANQYIFDYAGGNLTRIQEGSDISGFRLFGEASEIQSGGVAWAPATATDYYVAITRSGTSVTSAIGTTGATIAKSAGTSAQNFGNSTGALRLGNQGGGSITFGLKGKMRYVRLTKGVSRDITVVPTFPFPTS